MPLSSDSYIVDAACCLLWSVGAAILVSLMALATGLSARKDVAVTGSLDLRCVGGLLLLLLLLLLSSPLQS